MNTLLQNRQAMNKRTKEKGAFPDEFFRHQGRKTVCKTPRRHLSGLLLSELLPTYSAVKGVGCA